MKEYDVFRDSGWRYMGYANEVGESFRPLVSRSIVNLSYAVAITYVCADTVDKSIKSHNKGNIPIKTAVVAGDVFIWQMLASVLIPGYTINRTTWAARYLMRQLPKTNKKTMKAVPTIIGLLAIPLIIHPIDRLVDNVMDYTYRKLFM